MVKVGSAYYGQTSIVAENSSPQDGVYEAIKARFNKFTIVGDNLIVIHAIKGPMSTPQQIIIENVHFLLSQNIQYEINHIFHEANMTAD